MSESFFNNAKLTLSMHFRKLAFTVITENSKRGTEAVGSAEGEARPEFGFAAHCLADKPRRFAWPD